MDTTLPAEVLIQVAEYLNPADLATACCVNRTWFIPFASQLWRSLHKDQFSQEALLRALPRYSGFVRELRCSRFGQLSQLGPECTRLCVIEVPVLALGHKNGCALEILERNPDLEEISVFFPSLFEASQQLMRFIGIVVGMKKLRKLIINGFMAPDRALEYLLEMLPGLEELSIELWQNTPDAVLDPDFVAWREQKEVAGMSKTDDHRNEATLGALTAGVATSTLQSPVTISTSKTLSSSPRPLRKLSLVDLEFSFEAFLKLVRDYPLLESIVLEGSNQFNLFRPVETPIFIPFCEQLRVLCPRLDQLSLKSVDIDNEGLELFLTAFPRLKRFALANTPLNDCDVLRILLNHQDYAETLEEIELTQDSATRPSDAETLEVLRRFHRLRRLHVTYGKVQAEALVQLLNGSNDEQLEHPQQHPSMTNYDGDQGGQVALGHGHAAGQPGQFLEKLEVTIVGASRGWAPSTYFSEDDESVQEVDEQDQQQQHGDDEVRTYPLFDTLMALLRERTLLDMDRWMKSKMLDYML
ncbi:hypothetical protein BGW39_001863 [Mortierella sp. 14UC]|nr:hypothetical protein BGW39_001863 [Mortierella sp. 14UC]